MKHLFAVAVAQVMSVTRMHMADDDAAAPAPAATTAVTVTVPDEHVSLLTRFETLLASGEAEVAQWFKAGVEWFEGLIGNEDDGSEDATEAPVPAAEGEEGNEAADTAIADGSNSAGADTGSSATSTTDAGTASTSTTAS